jgi:hypothetical protein
MTRLICGLKLPGEQDVRDDRECAAYYRKPPLHTRSRKPTIDFGPLTLLFGPPKIQTPLHREDGPANTLMAISELFLDGKETTQQAVLQTRETRETRETQARR